MSEGGVAVSHRSVTDNTWILRLSSGMTPKEQTPDMLDERGDLRCILTKAVQVSVLYTDVANITIRKFHYVKALCVLILVNPFIPQPW